MTATMARPVAASVSTAPVRKRRRGWIFHAVMIPVSLIWVLPMVFVVLLAFRSFDDVSAHGTAALPHSFSWTGFSTALGQGAMGRALWISVQVTVPAVIITLFLASMAAYALSRFAIPGRPCIRCASATYSLPITST